MMQYEESMELQDKTACSGIRADLKKCLLECDCVKKALCLQPVAASHSVTHITLRSIYQSAMRNDELLDREDSVDYSNKTPRECLKTNDPGVPHECLVLRTTFFECKRSLLDNRQRFRGRKGY